MAIPTIAAGNWKMNLTHSEALNLLDSLKECPCPDNTEMILAPPFVYLYEMVKAVPSNSKISIAAQNCHSETRGAFTGEISAEMLASIGVRYVLVGHSERRMYFNEGDEILLKKLHQALAHQLKPIFCCGEPLSQRQAGTHTAFVSEQLKQCIFKLDRAQFSQCMIAYEPIWAIGTGETATPEQAQDMHAHIRSLIHDHFGAEIAQSTALLYGGSVKPNNAPTLFSLPDVNGGLVGGASLKAADFCKIIQAG